MIAFAKTVLPPGVAKEDAASTPPTARIAQMLLQTGTVVLRVLHRVNVKRLGNLVDLQHLGAGCIRMGIT